MDRNRGKRVPIRRRVLWLVLQAILAALLAASITGIICIRWIKNASEDALTGQLESNLRSIVEQKAVFRGIQSLNRFNLLLTLPGRLGYQWVDRILQRLPSYEFIHGHMINLEPDPLCAQSNSDLRKIYENAIEDACLFIRNFVPAVRGRKEWSPLMDDNFESKRG